MSQRFIKYLPNEKASWLRQHHTPLYLLLTLAMERARWHNEPCPLGLEQGDAILGSFEEAGISRKQYRDAIEKGCEFDVWEIVWNHKNPKQQKRAIKGAIKALVVNIRNPMCWDLNLSNEGHDQGQSRANKGPIEGHKRRTLRREEEKERKKKDVVRHCGNVHNSVVEAKAPDESYEQSHNVDSSFISSEKINSFPAEEEQILQEIIDFRFYCGAAISESTRLRWMRSDSLNWHDIRSGLAYYKQMEKKKIAKGEYFDAPEAYLEKILKDRLWESHERREKVKQFEKQHFKAKERI